jgi:DedD protein
LAALPVAEAPRTYNNFWVQTGAFSTKTRAESAVESLEAKGIASIIDDSDIDGKTWFRVRVGPYVSENEANFWLALVKAIDGFNDSQVRVSQVPR